MTKHTPTLWRVIIDDTGRGETAGYPSICPVLERGRAALKLAMEG